LSERTLYRCTHGTATAKDSCSLHGAAMLSPAVAPPWRLFIELSHCETALVQLQSAHTVAAETLCASEH